MKNTFAVVDLSWIMHRYHLGYPMMQIQTDHGTIPSGHVRGTYNFILELSSEYKAVILAVDSNPTVRKNIYSEYKSNRKQKTGDPFIDYDVHQDLNDILKICTMLPNVWYVKEEGYEADDIIGTLISRSDNRWDFYFKDNDILQNAGTYNLCVSFGKDTVIGPAVDRRKYIFEKYGIMSSNLPVLWKTVKGDSGDCIPIGIERFPTKVLQVICDSEVFYKNNISFEDCLNAVLSYKDYTPKMKEKVDKLRNKDSDEYKRFKLSYDLVCPRFVDIVRRKMGDSGEYRQIMAKWNILQ